MFVTSVTVAIAKKDYSIQVSMFGCSYDFFILRSFLLVDSTEICI